MRVLVVGPSWAGDMVMAGGLIERLKILGAEIDWVGPEKTLALAQRIPGIRRLIALKVPHGELGLARRYRLGRSLRSEAYDWALVLPNSWKSALVPFFAGIPRRTGYLGEWRRGLLNDIRLLDRTALPRMVDRYAALAASSHSGSAAPSPRLEPDRDHGRELLRRSGIAVPAAPVLAICPGAEYGPAKRWPAPSFAEVARFAQGRGWQVWLFGSSREREAAQEVAGLLDGPCVDWTGRTSLAEAVDLLAFCSAVITNDSGLMHVAAALEVPVVAVFGSSSPRHTPPLSARAEALSLELPCSPCYQRVCPLGHTQCLHGLGPERVISALQTLVPERFAVP